MDDSWSFGSISTPNRFDWHWLLRQGYAVKHLFLYKLHRPSDSIFAKNFWKANFTETFYWSNSVFKFPIWPVQPKPVFLLQQKFSVLHNPKKRERYNRRLFPKGHFSLKLSWQISFVFNYCNTFLYLAQEFWNLKQSLTCHIFCKYLSDDMEEYLVCKSYIVVQ